MTKHLKFASIITAVFSLAVISLPAHANEDGACKEDAKKLCGDIKHGDGRIHDCLKAHQAELSTGCKENIAEAKEKFKAKREEVKAACKDDLAKYCANVTPGEGREMACLKSYEDKISAACKEKFHKRGMGMHKGTHHDHSGDKHDASLAPPAGK